MYRQLTTVTIQKKSVKYHRPCSSQISLIIEMIILGMKDEVLTLKEQQIKSRDEIFQACLIKLAKLHEQAESKLTTAKMINTITEIISGIETAKLFHQLIKECFPDIKQPFLLTDEAKSEIFILIFTEIIENLQKSTEYLAGISN